MVSNKSSKLGTLTSSQGFIDNHRVKPLRERMESFFYPLMPEGRDLIAVCLTCRTQDTISNFTQALTFCPHENDKPLKGVFHRNATKPGGGVKIKDHLKHHHGGEDVFVFFFKGGYVKWISCDITDTHMKQLCRAERADYDAFFGPPKVPKAKKDRTTLKSKKKLGQDNSYARADDDSELLGAYAEDASLQRLLDFSWQTIRQKRHSRHLNWEVDKDCQLCVAEYGAQLTIFREQNKTSIQHWPEWVPNEDSRVLPLHPDNWTLLMDSTDKLLREQGFEVRYSQWNKITYADKLIKDKVSQLPPEQLPLNLADGNIQSVNPADTGFGFQSRVAPPVDTMELLESLLHGDKSDHGVCVSQKNGQMGEYKPINSQKKPYVTTQVVPMNPLDEIEVREEGIDRSVQNSAQSLHSVHPIIQEVLIIDPQATSIPPFTQQREMVASDALEPATNYIDLMRHSDAIVGEHEFELLQQAPITESRSSDSLRIISNSDAQIREYSSSNLCSSQSYDDKTFKTNYLGDDPLAYDIQVADQKKLELGSFDSEQGRNEGLFACYQPTQHINLSSDHESDKQYVASDRYEKDECDILDYHECDIPNRTECDIGRGFQLRRNSRLRSHKQIEREKQEERVTHPVTKRQKRK